MLLSRIVALDLPPSIFLDFERLVVGTHSLAYAFPPWDLVTARRRTLSHSFISRKAEQRRSSFPETG